MNKPTKKQRLDHYLVAQGHFPSRARAQAAVKEGLVSVSGVTAKKSSVTVQPSDEVAVAGDVHPFVSRGGVKLEAALREHEIDPAGMTCLDLGASTGGFTDVLLRKGAKKVYAVDVGTGQLHDDIARDPRVINLEQTHAKDLSRALIPEPIDMIVCDVSFISIRKALPPVLALAAPGARLAALIKPQFEVGRAEIGRGGIVKPGYKNSYGLCVDMVAWMNLQPGWQSTGYIDSPIAGGDGNKEFLLGAIKKA